MKLDKSKEISWIPMIWKCSSCGYEYDGNEFIENKYWSSDELTEYLKTDEFKSFKERNIFTNHDFIIASKLDFHCKGCETKGKLNSILFFKFLGSSQEKFELDRIEILNSDNLILKQTGFLYRGIDIYSAIENMFLYWWGNGAKILVINPFITKNEWELFENFGYVVNNLNYQFSSIKLEHDPIDRIIFQDSQCFKKKNIKGLIHEFENKRNESFEENPDLMMFRKEGLSLFKDKIFVTKPKNPDGYNKESYEKNSGKFHAKLYAGIFNNNVELILTSFNLVESEFLQIETFTYEKNIDINTFNGEIEKLLKDKFMKLMKI